MACDAGADGFEGLSIRGAARERASDPARTVERFRAVSARTTGAPAPPAIRLVEAIVHGEDIRHPLGLHHDYPTAHVVTALRHQLGTGVKLGGGKERARGLHLVVTDAGLGIGAGEEVRGTAVALLLAVSGRPVAPEELTGPGATRLSG